MTFQSIEDLKTKFLQEHNPGQLISIPVVKLQNYSSVPVHLTEDDIRTNIKLEEEELLQERMPLIQAKKQDVQKIVCWWQSHFQSQRATEKAAEDLNNLLFECIYTGDKDCSCQSCQSRTCTHPSSGKCKINKGEQTVLERAKQGFKYKWEEVLRKVQPNKPDQDFATIQDFTREEVKRGIHLQMQKEVQGILANMLGRNTENNLTGILELILQKRKGLLLNGFNVKENLKRFLAAFNIKLKEYSKNLRNGQRVQQERKEIEHDILHLAPHRDEVLALFVQAKSQLNLPWTEANRVENARKVIEKACSQGVADVETFAELASHFLTEEQFKLIRMNFNITMSDLRNVPETEICLSCRDNYVFEEDRGKEGGPKYSFNQLKTLFGLPFQQEPATQRAHDVYTLLSTIYAGGGSLVKLIHTSRKVFTSKKLTKQCKR